MFIFRKIEKLRAVCMSRLQMNKLSRYISTCKHAVHLQSRVGIHAVHLQSRVGKHAVHLQSRVGIKCSIFTI